MALHDSRPVSQEIDAGEEDVFRLSLVTPPLDTPIAPAAAVHPRPIAGPTLPAATPLSSRAGSGPTRPFVDHEKASSFLEKLSATELRTVMRVLRIKGKMQAKMADKRAIALVAMEDQQVDDVALEAMMDDADLALPSTPSSCVPAFVAPIASFTPSPSGRALSAGCSAPPAVRAASAAPIAITRGPSFSANDFSRLAHVVTDPAHFQAVRDDGRPLSRAELDKPRDSLWDSVLAPAFNNPEYKPARARAVDGVLESDLRGMDPTRFTCRRDASKLETIYRAMRSNYTKTYANYTRSGQLEGGVFKDFINGEHQLLYLHCLLFDNPSVDFVLRSLPHAAQAEVGLPGSSAVGRGPGHPGSAPVPARKRSRQAEVTIGGMDGLTSAIVALGNSGGLGAPDAAGRRSADAFDNAEAMAAVWKQLKVARAAVAEDPMDMLAASMRAHCETQLEKLMEAS